MTLVRGFQAMTGEAPPPPVAEALRRVSRTGGTGLAGVSRGPVAADWLKPQDAGARESAPARFGDLELIAIVQQHRLEARRGSKIAWSFVAGARISSPPVVSDGLAIFGAHDGWVYAVDLAGRLRWKYLVAPGERLVSVNSQLENYWPVYGAALLDGDVVASAGTHPELGGGVRMVALDPASGGLVWERNLVKRPSTIPAGGKGAEIVSYSFINTVPRVDGYQVVLGDGGPLRGEFRFRSTESATAIRERLNSAPEKHKR